MIVKRKTSNLIGRALRLALCYVFALQAFAAALSTASAIGPASGIASVICHTSEDGSAPNDSGLPQSAACALCAVAATAVAVPPPVLFGAQRLAIAIAISPPATQLLAAPPAIRSGLARAPPHFA